MKIMNSTHVQDLMNKLNKTIEEFVTEFPVDALNAPGWLCIDVAMTNNTRKLRATIKKVVANSIHPETIRFNFETMRDILERAEEEEMKDEPSHQNT